MNANTTRMVAGAAALAIAGGGLLATRGTTREPAPAPAAARTSARTSSTSSVIHECGRAEGRLPKKFLARCHTWRRRHTQGAGASSGAGGVRP